MLRTLATISILTLVIGCAQPGTAGTPGSSSRADGADLPERTASTVRLSHVIGWPAGKTPVAPAGFRVTRFAAEGLTNPRNVIATESGDVFISEADTNGRGRSADDIWLFRDADGDGKPEAKFQFLAPHELDRPFGMAIATGAFYVGANGGLWKFSYKPGQTSISNGKKILDLPAGGYNNHWTRNLLLSEDGSKLYVSVGSGSNVGEHGLDNEIRRANILQVNLDGGSETVFASGLRNPVGMSWNPASHKLWTVVNERDELGDELVPDYLTSVQSGGFYGWPFSYFGNHKDDRVTEKPRVEPGPALVPDVALGAHTATLGLAFCGGTTFPERFRGGAFLGQHGSWNSSKLVGYRVAFVPFKDGKASGPAEDFLTGFRVGGESNDVYGRPVSVAQDKSGALLVTDDAGNTVWRVTTEAR